MDGQKRHNFRGQWRGRGGRGNNWRGGWNKRGRGGWRGRGKFGGSGSQAFIPKVSTPQQSMSVLEDREEDFNLAALATGSSVTKTFSINGSQILSRPFVNGIDGEATEERIEIAKEYLKGKSGVDTDSTKFELDYHHMINDSRIQCNWPTINEELENNAECVLGIFGIAQHQLDIESKPAGPVPIIEEQVKPRLPRLVGHEPLTAVKNIRTSMYGKLVTISATVIRVSNIRPICTWLTFQCEKCLAVMSTEQPYGRYQYPAKCITPQCRSRTFTPQRSHEQTLTVDFQSVRLQEVLFSESGRVPRTIDAELTADLCDVVAPSDVVTLTGVVKAMPVTDQGTSKGGAFNLYLHAVALSCANKLKPSAAAIQTNLTTLDQQFIRELYECGESLFKLIVASLAPSIYGHDLVKAGLLLGLFGGTSKNFNGNANIPTRGDPHILVVGDPGLGKSQMLLACANVAPRGIFVTATGVTTSGLTVTLSKEAGNEFVLEAGALVLADQGCCCIDEFDKMTSQHNSLLEAMEQQSVSIAKSGVVCSLPARTGVLAAANPVGGHYNKAKTVSENLKINPALLSRFDLVFILVDKPNEELDAMLSDHIMNMHATKDDDHRRKSSSTSFMSTSVSSTNSKLSSSGSLKERLRRHPGEPLDLLPHELMSKYIAYARQYVHPKLTPEACTVIQNFYLELRKQYQNSESTPITTRQLESLIRLTEARARLQLRYEATRQDAEDVVEIMQETMIDVFSDGLGCLDFSRAVNGSGMSARSASKKFISALQTTANNQRKNIFNISELKQVLAVSRIKVDNFYNLLESLNTQGYLIKKGSGIYQLITVDY